MVFYSNGTGSALPELRVWLGGGNGWSVPLQLPEVPLKTQVRISISSGCYAVCSLEVEVFVIGLVYSLETAWAWANMHTVHSQATLLRAGGFGEGVPSSPAVSELQSADCGSVICHVSPPSAETGQVVIALRPLYELHNGLPCGVHLRLSQLSEGAKISRNPNRCYFLCVFGISKAE